MKRLILSLAPLTLAAGCATVPAQTGTTAFSEAIPHDITAGQARLAVQLYPKLAEAAEPNDNLFISPLSLSEGLGLALPGARGQTEAEMRDLLGWDAASRPELLVKDYDRFLTSTGDDKVALSVANALWLSNRLDFTPDYLRAAKNGFGANARKVDFGGNPAGSANTINGWVSEQTRERITKIVDASGFNDLTAAVLTNAVWFKADWSVPFEDGSTGEFTRGDGTKMPIYMMERIAPMAYRETREGQAVQLPYGKDGRFVMEVFLPRDMATLRRWERDLNAGSFDLSMQGSDAKFDLGAAEEREILLRLPRFEARFDDSVKAALIAAGMPCAFSPTCADFGAMADTPLAIDDVAHATFLRVDEKGTEAAAVTAVKIIVTGSRRLPDDLPRMIVDRSFLLTIRDRASGALIFFGRIADPTPVEQAE
ncbi:serpin family protein [Qipengyuania sp. NPDC077410]|jgi:serpin B|uniref:serpin family protein n=1 Tax=Qipengyuania sp. NPDC077410 TaxID=3364496 RepID=UPI0037C6ECA9|tara:strand:- start:3358 stop:4632 length:1275 start_codon:yes stop_codon:yes gene_type:complete